MKRIISRPFIANEVDGYVIITIDNISYKILGEDFSYHPLFSLNGWISKENFTRICEVQGFELGNNPQNDAHSEYDEYISTNQGTSDVCFCIQKNYLFLATKKGKSPQSAWLIEGVWILEKKDLLKKPKEKDERWIEILSLLIMGAVIVLGIRLIILNFGHISEWLKMLWIFIRNI